MSVINDDQTKSLTMTIRLHNSNLCLHSNGPYYCGSSRNHTFMEGDGTSYSGEYSNYEYADGAGIGQGFSVAHGYDSGFGIGMGLGYGHGNGKGITIYR